MGLIFCLCRACNQPHTAPTTGAHQCRFRRLLEIHLLALKGEAVIHQNNPGAEREGPILRFSSHGPRQGWASEVPWFRHSGVPWLCHFSPLGCSFPICQRWQGAELLAHASEPPASPPPSSLPFQRHYKSNGLERKASKILKPSSIINADNKFPLRAFYIATVTKTRWWSCRSSPLQLTALSGLVAITLPSLHLYQLAAHQALPSGRWEGILIRGNS